MLLGKKRKPIKQITRLKENNSTTEGIWDHTDGQSNLLRPKVFYFGMNRMNLLFNRVWILRIICIMLCSLSRKYYSWIHKSILSKKYLGIYNTEFDDDSVGLKKISCWLI